VGGGGHKKAKIQKKEEERKDEEKGEVEGATIVQQKLRWVKSRTIDRPSFKNKALDDYFSLFAATIP
jgi:hypothetical protein